MVIEIKTEKGKQAMIVSNVECGRVYVTRSLAVKGTNDQEIVKVTDHKGTTHFISKTSVVGWLS